MNRISFSDRALALSLIFFLCTLSLPAAPAQATNINVYGGQGGAGGNGGIGSDTPVGTGSDSDPGGSGSDGSTDPGGAGGVSRPGTSGMNSTGGYGGTGGAGGSGTFTASGDYGVVAVRGGTGGTGGNGGDGQQGRGGTGGIGGAGGQASLSVTSNLNVANSLTVQGGDGGTNGNGGATGNIGGGCGGAGGLGGDASLNTTGSLNVMNDLIVQGGTGGDNISPIGSSLNGGNGGNAALDAPDQIVTVAGSLWVASGNNGVSDWSAQGLGGTATFTAGTLIAPIINLTRNDGALTFKVDTLQIASGGTTLTATGLQAGDAAIGTLLLTNDQNFTLNGTGVSVGQLTIDGGTLNNTNWGNLVSDGGMSYSTTNDITLGDGGATVLLNSGEDQTLARNLVGTGSLTKDGAGTLTLTGANTYSGGTILNDGTLQAGAAGAFVNNTEYVVNGGTLDLNNFNLAMSSLSGTGGTVALGTADLTVNQATDTSYDGVISGSGSLVKDGSGVLTLTGANTYNGNLTINGGSMTVGDGTGGGLGYTGSGYNYSGSVTIAAGSALAFDQSVDQTLSGVISGDGILGKDGAGTLTLNGNNSYSGFTGLLGGRIVAGTNSALGTGDLKMLDGTSLGFGANNLTLSNNLVLVNQSGGTSVIDVGLNNATLSGTISDFDGAAPGNLTKDGAGKLTLTGTNTYTGDTTVSEGTLQIGNFSAPPPQQTGWGSLGDPSSDGGYSYSGNISIAPGAELIFDQGGYQTLTGDISGTGSLTLDGIVILKLTGANPYDGNLTINGGSLTIGDGTSGGLGYTGSGYNYSGSVDIAAGSSLAFNQSVDQTLSGVISGDGIIGKIGTGTLTLNGDNSYSGGTEVLEGRIVAGTNSALGTGDLIMLDGTSLGFGANNLTLDNDLILANQGGGTSVIDVGLNNATLSGTISDFPGMSPGNLTKDGTGTLTLTGANTYTGLTEVLAGTLALSGAGRISPTLALYNGSAFSPGSGNVGNLSQVDVHGSAAWQGDLNMAGKAMNFYVPTGMTAGGTMLTVSGSANIGGSTVNVGIDGASSPLKSGDQITLINAATLTGIPVSNMANGQGMQGVTLLYDFDLSPTDNKLLATVANHDLDPAPKGNDPGSVPKVNPQAKALSEGFLSGLALTNQGADLVAGQGIARAIDATRGTGFGAFASVSGGWSRYDTGSHADMSSINLLAGLSLTPNSSLGRLTLGAFIEWGNGSYNTYNSFSQAADVNGDGTAWYLGGGILGRIDFAGAGPGNFYTEASLRAGGVHNDYNTSDLRDAMGRGAEGYDSSSPYYGTHLGLGYIWNITEPASLDLYGKYFWTHQNGDDVTLATGDPVRFAGADSHRLRLGSRLAYVVNEYVSPYIGAAWEHEFDGKARATAYGYGINEPSLSGDTGVGELGLYVKPSKTLALSLDAGIQGYAGTREGVIGSLQVRYDF